MAQNGQRAERKLVSPAHKHEQLALVEFKNTEPFIYRFVSKKPITIERIAQHLMDEEDFNEDRDSVTFVDAPTIVKLM